MPSKLHKGGTVASSAVPWEPGSKNGPQAAYSAAGAAANARGAGIIPDVQARSREQDKEAAERDQAAFRRGVEVGAATERQQAAAQLEAALEGLARTVQEIAGIKPRLRREAESEVVNLAIAIARRVLHRELATDPDALGGLLRSALDKLDGREVHRLRVNAHDAAAMERFMQQIGSSRKIEIFPDTTLARGSAIFDTAHGSFDASVETQLNEIERGFADVIGRAS